MSDSRIYLDHAATAWPKPERTLAAMDAYARECGVAAGRGAHRAAQHAGAVVQACRQKLAQLVQAESPTTISLHSSGTAALNVAIHGILQRGDHVITTAAEHNSVLRPLQHLATTLSIDLTIVPCDHTGWVAPADVAGQLRAETKLVAVTHASNVTGAVQDIDQFGRLLNDHPARLLCDAAQTLGYLPIDVAEMGIDLLAAPGHKGAGGPLGTGMLYVRKAIQPELCPLIQGGTGSQSESMQMPEEYPDKVEAGSLNLPAIAGWLAGLDAIEVDNPLLDRLTAKLYAELSAIPGVTVIGSAGSLPTASVCVEGLSPIELAAILDSEFNIQTRAGFHCAALIHRYLGTHEEGTLRLSAGRTTTEEEIETACDALRAIVAELPV